MLGLPLRLALRATLGIPRGSVGAQTVGVGANRLARALAARRQRLTVGTEPRLPRGSLPPATMSPMGVLAAVLASVSVLAAGLLLAGSAHRTRTPRTTRATTTAARSTAAALAAGT